MERMLAGNGYLAQEYVSALTVAVIMLIPQILLLMPLYAALVGGDLVAKEVEDGTLRMILSRPISRFRLLLVKWVAGVIFSAVLVLVLGGTALGFARMWFPWKGMFVFVPGQVFNVLSAAQGFKLYLWSHAIHDAQRERGAGHRLHVLLLQHEARRGDDPGPVAAVREPGDGRHPVLRALPRVLADLPLPLLAQRLRPANTLGAIGQSLCVLLAVNLTTFLIGRRLPGPGHQVVVRLAFGRPEIVSLRHVRRAELQEAQYIGSRSRRLHN